MASSRASSARTTRILGTKETDLQDLLAELSNRGETLWVAYEPAGVLSRSWIDLRRPRRS